MKPCIGVVLIGCALTGGVLFNGEQAVSAARKTEKTKPPTPTTQQTTPRKLALPPIPGAPAVLQVPQEILLLKIEPDVPEQVDILNALAELPFIHAQVAPLTPEAAWGARLRRVPSAELNAPNSLVNSKEFGPRQSTKLANGDGIALERADGTMLIMLDANTTSMMPQLLRAVRTEQRWQFLKSLPPQMPASTLSISLRLVPVEVEKDEQGVVTKVVGDKAWKRDEKGQILAAEGDYLMAEVANTGKEAEYITVFDLPSDGQIQPILPVPRLPIDNLIPPDDQWHRLPMPYVFVLDRSRGTGMDIFKAVATRDAVDFTPWLNYRWPNRQRGALAEFAKEWATDQVTMLISKRDAK